MRRWEYGEGDSSKFWEAEADGATVTVRYGRCGTEGRTQVKECASPEEAAEYLRKTITAKERKGYQEVGAAPAAEGDAPVPEASVVDEDTFVLPASWHRHLHPRRGGVRRKPAPPRKGAASEAEQRLSAGATWVRLYLDSPRSDADLLRAAEAHLAGTADPLGAAVLAVASDMAWSGAACADAWVEAHGPVFAARATVELFDVEGHYTQHGTRRFDPYVERTPNKPFAGAAERVRGVADRMRALLAAADEDTYRTVVAALTGMRSSARRRVVVSYLVPSETEWLNECAGGPEANRPRNNALRSMLFCSFNDPEQVRQLGGVAGLSYGAWPMPTVATVAEGIGTAVAPLVAESLSGSYVTSDTIRKVNSILVEIPSDEAFALLMAQLGDKRTQPFVTKAARRYPRRALRMLAEAVAAGGPNADALRHTLLVHVSAHPDLAGKALASLSPEAAGAVEPLLSPQGRVPDAPAASLPELLTSPPWTRPREAVKVRTVTGLVAEDAPGIVWLPGERQEWADTQSRERDWASRSEWPDDPDALLSAVRSDKVGSMGIFLDKPEELVRPLLDEWNPTSLDSDAALKPIVARFGTDALGVVLGVAPKWPTSLAPLLLPYVSVGAARLVAEWAVRLKSARGTARSWFRRHGEAAAPLLVPDAVGKAGPARRHAEQALHTIAALHGEQVVRSAAERYGAEAVAAIGELLSDPLRTALPAKLPEPVEWAEPVLLPQILVRSGGALPADATRHAVTMLAMSRPGEPYPGVAVVRELCVPESLAEFVWALFEQWRLAGMPSQESWALGALGLLGDDETVRRLTPLVRAWPGEGAHQRAVDGLGVLAAIGTDVALMHLHGVAQRVKFKALRTRALEKIAELAEDLGLTGEQLADRLVPDLGLDARGTTDIDYGSRTFTVGFDEQLRPFVQDPDGRRRKDLPQPGSRDDAELAAAERKRFMALKKDVRTIAADQVRRLESAMVQGRSWSAAEFRELFVGHPLLWHLVRRLVWLSDTDGTTTAFRVAEDRTFADVEDSTFVLPDTASVRIAHPLLLPGGLDVWAELFADHEILQPFPQLGRQVFELAAEEAAGWRLERFEGLTVTTGRLVGLERRGWRRGQPLDAGVERWISKQLAPNRYAVLTPDHGIAVGFFDPAEQQKVEHIWLATRPGDYWPRDTHSARFEEIDPVAVSELLADLTELTAP
ncbi:DUF4132 domain-containing protein [Streptomyces sp. NPDC057474]|uniref:DUF4132 domain-containing protein n=1 Tax=Streptomyces sp. NPDC057474 TaxID=3346144 RepID=UPI00368B3ECF